MTQQEMFGSALWVGAPTRGADDFAVLRGHFTLETVEPTSLQVVGLGFFQCYINGALINPDTFLPLSSDFEATADPEGEVLTGHRLYVPAFDITRYVQEGDNVIAVHYGGGWYTYRNRPFGLPKAIYRIVSGDREFVSSAADRIAPGLISDYHFTDHETQDATAFDEGCLAPGYDDGVWTHAVPTEGLDTRYLITDCPTDTLQEEVSATLIYEDEEGKVYDCGRNLSGYPVFRTTAPRGSRVEVSFSEARLSSGGLDMAFNHYQHFAFTAPGGDYVTQPRFTWFSFRYFRVKGEATPTSVKFIHADVRRTSTFHSDSETLNWIHDTFIHTMCCNLHTGHPSDCPHLERRGYTGDGQVTCHAAMSVLDLRSLYRKWVADIADGQDTLSGHVQYTAPYIRSGGGPGGFGSAIVEVPWQYYRHYGDDSLLREYYGQMRRYLDFMEAHSVNGLVNTSQPGIWCLGDWCGPVIYPDVPSIYRNQQMMLPASMVNTYFYVKSLRTMAKIAAVIGREEDAPAYEQKARERCIALEAAYFNSFDGNYLMCLQGANAYALDCGLGSERTYTNLVNHYTGLGRYDTGIFGTDIVTRVLFERGNAQLAFDLLTSRHDNSYEAWRRSGATTFQEYWQGGRSLNHHMFGSVVAYLFEYLMGIRQPEDTAGYTRLEIAPQLVEGMNELSGSMEIPAGTVRVAYRKETDRVRFTVTVPEGVDAIFRCGDTVRPLTAGETVFTIGR